MSVDLATCESSLKEIPIHAQHETSFPLAGCWLHLQGQHPAQPQDNLSQLWNP